MLERPRTTARGEALAEAPKIMKQATWLTVLVLLIVTYTWPASGSIFSQDQKPGFRVMFTKKGLDYG